MDTHTREKNRMPEPKRLSQVDKTPLRLAFFDDGEKRGLELESVGRGGEGRGESVRTGF